jgi:hypothetical protein
MHLCSKRSERILCIFSCSLSRKQDCDYVPAKCSGGEICAIESDRYHLANGCELRGLLFSFAT